MQVFSLQDALQQPQAVTHLHLDRAGLVEVPRAIQYCTNLRVLNLQGNQLEHLPDWLPRLSQLEVLNVSGNQLKKWTADWSAWTSLKTLNLKQNQLRSIRGARLPGQLENFDLSYNRLRTLAVSHLPVDTLLRLDVSHNSLKQLPDLGACGKLRQLNAQKNLLREWPVLPVSTGPLEGLRILSLAQNRLQRIPGRIGDCQALRELNLAGNQLQALPAGIKQLKWLVRLSLEGNQLTRIPGVLRELKLLDQLSLADNQIAGRINLRANEQLRRLDLSKNPIKQIVDLPVSLRQLNLRGLSLSDWTFLRKLTQLAILELPKTASEELLLEICYLPQLSTLRGLLPYGKKEKLLQLLHEAFTPVEKRALIDFWILKKSENIDPLLLQKVLLSNIVALRKQARLHLLAGTEGQVIPEDAKEIYLLGSLESKQTELEPLFAAKAIRKTSTARIAILGRAPYSAIPADHLYDMYSEAQLLAFLRKQYAKTSFWTAEELQKLKKRLLHSNPSQVKLALLLLDKETVPAQLLPALILAGKLQEEPRLKQSLLELARKHCPVEYETLLQTPFQTQGQTDLKAAINRWAERAYFTAEERAQLLALVFFD